jgi:hypothetical protein
MNDNEPYKDKSTAEIEAFLNELKGNFTKALKDPKFLLEIVVFIVIGIYTFFTILMYCANKQSADAATGAANTAERTMRLDQRAWVAVTAVNSKTALAVDQTFTYSVHFIDTGKTPASNVIVHPGDELLEKGQPPNLSVDSGPVRLGILSPGSERTIDKGLVPDTRRPKTLTKEDLDVLKTKTLSVHGKITYDDIFGCHHWITYCAYLKDDWTGYAFCNVNNDTDPIEQSCQRD